MICSVCGGHDPAKLSAALANPPTVATDLLDAKAWAYIGKQAACGDSEAQSLIDLLKEQVEAARNWSTIPAQAPSPVADKSSAPPPADSLLFRTFLIGASPAGYPTWRRGDGPVHG
jgi:hypothetical protein